ncbi:hypothetical protein ACFXHA_14295 [Nocardia sp. NPDC059240]|uniref:hypothetical protein n=1 Tax=Nocardia sp. NPDC059240 TaxID=3346786 RepID=UPI0036905E4A
MNNQIQFADRNFGYFTVQQPRRINYRIATAFIIGMLTLGFAGHMLLPEADLSDQTPASVTVLR